MYVQLSNNQDFPGDHDEIDIEFLGTTPDKPYTLQTNVYMRGSGDGNIIGREKKIHLWFDPTKAFHDYAILWNPTEIMYSYTLTLFLINPIIYSYNIDVHNLHALLCCVYVHIRSKG